MGRSLLVTAMAAVILAGVFFFVTGGSGGQLTEITSQLQLEVLEVEKLVSTTDKNRNGVPDTEDILAGARREISLKPVYKDAYYLGGYPPPDEGVCTDVIWRALAYAGYDIKALVDRDIRENLRLYPRVGGQPDPNIDFRRVKNLVVFFSRHAQSLTTEVIPGDKDNLVLWQGGDIVVFGDPTEHIAIVSDRRGRDGVPLIIHNAGPVPREDNWLLKWPSPITHHFRFPPVLDENIQN